MKYTLCLFIGLLIPFATYGWEDRLSPQDPETYTIRYRGEPFASLESILSTHTKRLTGIDLGRLVKLDDPTIQADIRSYLTEHYPDKYKKMIGSSGNLHNPHLRSIKPQFDSAICRSRYVASINKLLARYGYYVAGVSSEKFFLIKEADTIRFDAITWLKVKQVPGTSTSRPPCPGLATTGDIRTNSG